MRYPTLTRILAADPEGPQAPAEADLDEGADLHGFHLHINVAFKEIDQAIELIRMHDPKQDEVKVLQKCKELLQSMMGELPEGMFPNLPPLV